MPIEIRELVIRATVEPGPGNSPQPSGTNTNTHGNTSPGEDLINSCVEKLLGIIKEKNER